MEERSVPPLIPPWGTVVVGGWEEDGDGGWGRDAAGEADRCMHALHACTRLPRLLPLGVLGVDLCLSVSRSVPFPPSISFRSLALRVTNFLLHLGFRGVRERNLTGR